MLTDEDLAILQKAGCLADAEAVGRAAIRAYELAPDDAIMRPVRAPAVRRAGDVALRSQHLAPAPDSPPASRVPSLRERREDIPLLAGYFLEKYARRLGRKIDDFSADAKTAMLRYEFPGNVRELENAVERAVTLAEGPMIQREDLPSSFYAPTMLPAAGGAGFEEARDAWSLEEVEKEHIQRVLRRQKGNVTNTARQLGISRTTLWRKMNKFRLARPGA